VELIPSFPGPVPRMLAGVLVMCLAFFEKPMTVVVWVAWLVSAVALAEGPSGSPGRLFGAVVGTILKRIAPYVNFVL